MKLKPIMQSWTHVGSDTSVFLRRLRAVQLPKKFCFVKADVKEYFLSGSQTQLANAASRVVSESRVCTRRVVEFLLASQFVRIPRSKKTFRVRRGSGMGLRAVES